MGVIAILSDFGQQDWFVAAMKGVIADISPDARTIDITHSISPGNIRSAAFALKNCYSLFPKKTVFLVVVDPDVGSDRMPLAVKTNDYYFIAPDNGVLTFALQEETNVKPRSIKNRRIIRQYISNTFHGRDVFAPAAAHLTRGTPFNKVGPLLPEIIRLHWPQLKIAGDRIHGEIVHIDRFGNLITNLSMAEVVSLDSDEISLSLGGKKNIPLRKRYCQVKRGKALAVLGSCNLLEIAINKGNAAETLSANIGTKVILKTR